MQALNILVIRIMVVGHMVLVALFGPGTGNTTSLVLCLVADDIIITIGQGGVAIPTTQMSVEIPIHLVHKKRLKALFNKEQKNSSAQRVILKALMLNQELDPRA